MELSQGCYLQDQNVGGGILIFKAPKHFLNSTSLAENTTLRADLRYPQKLHDNTPFEDGRTEDFLQSQG